MSVAKSYAKALHEASQDAKTPAQEVARFEAGMDDLLGVLQVSKDARVTLLGPATSAKEKAAIVDALSRRLGVPPLLHTFFLLLARKDRLSILDDIREAYGAVKLESEGGIQGKLVSADPLDPTDVESLSRAFGAKLGKKVAFISTTDASLLAGMKVTVNGTTYDGTLRSQLQRLRDKLVYGADSVH